MAVYSDLGAEPQPWEYNPSAWRQRTIHCLIALPAVLAAAYMELY